MANNSIETFLGNSQPLVIIPANLMEYIREIVDQCPDEISWIMEVTELENFIYEIDAVFIPRQKVHGATTEFEADDIINLMEVEPTFKPEKWRGWGHSHVNMGVSPSSQDKKMMMEFSKDCEFFIGMIHNKGGDVFCWVVDNTRKIFIKDVDVHVISEYEDEIKQLIKERVSKLVETPKATQSTMYPSTVKPGKYSPFNVMGRNVIACTKNHNGVSQFGYEVEGVFFPASTCPTPAVAVGHYEDLVTEVMVNSKSNFNPSIKEVEFEEIPPSHHLTILDEIEDYNMVNHGSFKDFVDTQADRGLF